MTSRNAVANMQRIAMGRMGKVVLLLCEVGSRGGWVWGFLIGGRGWDSGL